MAFPAPGEHVVENNGIGYVTLPTLVELKLVSGMTNAGRLKDLADVQHLIKVLHLHADFAGHLNPYVLARFAELWQAAQPPGSAEPERAAAFRR